MFSQWTPWSDCGQTCASGTRFRTRFCRYGVVGQNACVGELLDLDTCNTQVSFQLKFIVTQQYASGVVRIGYGKDMQSLTCHLAASSPLCEVFFIEIFYSYK